MTAGQYFAGPPLARLDQKDYDPAWPVCARTAVRAILWANDSLALVYSSRKGYYKFPGGGVEPGETHAAALLREVREETGLVLHPDSLRPYGYMQERRKDHGGNQIFLHTSYYYLAEILRGGAGQQLDGYEQEDGYQLVFCTPQQALSANEALFSAAGDGFLRRENLVLALLTQRAAPL